MLWTGCWHLSQTLKFTGNNITHCKYPKNVRFVDKKLSPENLAISGDFLFENPFVNLCSGKERFTED